MIYTPITLGRILSTLVIACALAAFSAQPADAQTAKKLKCNGCVKSKQIKNNRIKSKDIKDGHVRTPDLANDAVDFTKLGQTVEDAIKQDRTFYVTLDGFGDEATLVTQGSLSIFARCFVDDGGNDRIEIVHTGTADGWFVMNSPVERTAGEEVIALNIPVPTGTTRNFQTVASGAIAPDGSTIAPFSLLGLGFNVFGHICLVQGLATAFTGTP